MMKQRIVNLSKPKLFKRKKYILNLETSKLACGERTIIMGILNCTPDSFSTDGIYAILPPKKTSIKRKILQIINHGADIIDVGGESTRPGAKRISEEQEIKRTLPIIREIRNQSPNIPVSIDTYKSNVAKAALDAGANVVNNIMGTKISTSMLKMIRNYQAAVVLMHIKGTPRTMQKKIQYKDLISEIYYDLQKSIEKCLEIGIKSDKIIIDPGIGFGKTTEHNLSIINQLSTFSSLNMPILIGTSRKSFIGKITNKDITCRLSGTIASVCASIFRGAHIVRIHDINEIRDAVQITDSILNESSISN